MASTSRTTRDHEEIRKWAEERGGKPSCVRNTGGSGDIGILRIDFPGFSGEDSLEPIGWEEWFQKFDERNLSLLYQEETAEGQKSNFNKIVSAESAEENDERTHRGAKKASGKRMPPKKSTAGQPAKKTAAKPAAAGNAQKRVTGKKAAGKKTATKKTAVKKAAAKTVASKKEVAKKAAPKKAAAKNTVTKKAAAKTSAAKNAASKKMPAKKTAARKSAPKKTAVKKAAAKKAARRR